jgi:hypothetical protein
MKAELGRQLLDLARAGASVLVWKELPQDVPGWFDHADRTEHLRELWSGLPQDGGGVARLGEGKLIFGDDLASLLEAAAIAREPLVDQGLKFIRRKSPSHTSYFIANHSPEPVNAWVPLALPCRSAVLMDPMTGHSGVAPVRVANDRANVYLQMRPGDTRVVRTLPRTSRRPLGQLRNRQECPTGRGDGTSSLSKAARSCPRTCPPNS